MRVPPMPNVAVTGLDCPLGKKLPACDLCHSRKVKCNRERQCRACLDAHVPCARTRQRRVRRRKKEPWVSQHYYTESNDRPQVPQPSGDVTRSDLRFQKCTSPAKPVDTRNRSFLMGRLYDERVQDQNDQNATPSEFPSTDRQPSLASGIAHDYPNQPDNTFNLIRQELDSNVYLSIERSSVLESALALVRRFVAASHSTDNPSHDVPVDSEFAMPEEWPIEMIYMMFQAPRANHTTDLINWPDHISLQTLEQMTMDLANRRINEQQALQYKLCICAKAASFVTRWLRFCSSDDFARCLEKSKKRYAMACLQYLKVIDFTRAPNLAMLQALLSGATIVQLLGDTTRSWYLTACASRALVALGYHSSIDSVSGNNKEAEIHRCIYWCYYLDKTLSMLLCRPSSLPDLHLNPVSLVQTHPGEPLSFKLKILVRLSYVQDVSLAPLLRQITDENRIYELVNSLQVEMNYIRAEILQFRTGCVDVPGLEIEWDAIDFTFFSIATSVLRLSPASLHDRSKREECLQYARKALVSMTACQSHIYRAPRLTTDFLFWTVLMYPLTPFFVIFCNVVATSHPGDLRLLRDITTTISKIKEQCTFGMNLYKLLSELIGLCDQLQDNPSVHISGQRDEHSQGYAMDLTPDYLPGNHPPSSVPVHELVSHGMPLNTPSRTPTSLRQGDSHVDSRRSSIWDDGLMWDLFNIQPSIGWFDTDCFDFLGVGN